jgi:hypothetical protein
MTAPNPLQDYLRVQQKMDVRMRGILIQAALTTARKILLLSKKNGVGARTREAQLGLFLEYLKQEQTELWVHTIYPLIVKTMSEAAGSADSAAEYIDQVLRTAVGDRQAEFLLEGIRVQARIAQQFDLSSRANVLSRRVWNNVERNTSRIQRIVQKHLVTGSVNARELAADVKRFIDPSTAGGASYAAMRLARTEINGAFHDRQRRIAQDRSWVKSVEWHLSRSHPHKDGCDLIFHGHSEGLRPGHYSSDEIPDKPHPQCLCHVTYDLLSDRDMTNLLRAKLGKAPLIA